MRINKTVISFTALLGLWAIITSAGIISPMFLPTPAEIIASFSHLIKSAEFYRHIFCTLLRAFTSFMIASVLGVSVGLVLGYFMKIRGYFELIIDFLRTMPSPALIPLSLVIFGIGDVAKVVVVTFSVSLIIIINTMYGVQSVKRIRRQVFHTFQANKLQEFTKLILPESMPHIISGLRTALSLTLIIIVVTEMLIGTHFGLGYIIQTEQLLFNIPEMYSYIIVLGAIGYILNKSMVYSERKLLFWASE